MKEFFANKSELLWGFIYGLVVTFNPLVAILTALVWRAGGVWGHSKRALGVPAIVVLYYHWPSMSWLYFLATFGVLTIGYSVPDVNQSKVSDLGAFWYHVFGGDSDKANVAVRTTIAILLAIAALPVLLWR